MLEILRSVYLEVETKLIKVTVFFISFLCFQRYLMKIVGLFERKGEFRIEKVFPKEEEAPISHHEVERGKG